METGETKSTSATLLNSNIVSQTGIDSIADNISMDNAQIKRPEDSRESDSYDKDKVDDLCKQSENLELKSDMSENKATCWDSVQENDKNDDSYTDTEDDFGPSGEESDIEDNDDSITGHFVRRRMSNPVLPDTVTVLESDNGGKVYLVGTAHFSKESQEDVAQVIQAVQPDVVMVELCSSRINILQLDEQTLLEEAKDINLAKIRTAIKQGGLVQGVMHLLLLSMSAHITKQLGMAPGGEFRTAFREARKVPGCSVHLGDRPIQVTLRRAIGSLSTWQKIRLAWFMIMNKEPISKEDVEKCKQKDLLEEMLAEMTGEFPALSRVFVHERDLYLTNSMRLATQTVKQQENEEGFVPPVVVSVVGIGHATGIKEHWNDQEICIKEIMQIPPGSLLGWSVKWTFRSVVIGLTSWLLYRVSKWALSWW